MESTPILRFSCIDVESFCDSYNLRYEKTGKGEYFIYIEKYNPVYIIDNSIDEVSRKLEPHMKDIEKRR